MADRTNWKSAFSADILMRGKGHFAEGKVADYFEKDGNVSASVRLSRKYFVSISGLNTRQPSWTCSCRDAIEGMNCEHIAAVLYSYEERQISRDKKTERGGTEVRHASQSSTRESLILQHLFSRGPYPVTSALLSDKRDRSELYYNLDTALKNVVIEAKEAESAREQAEDGTFSVKENGIFIKRHYRYSDYEQEKILYAHFCMDEGKKRVIQEPQEREAAEYNRKMKNSYYYFYEDTLPEYQETKKRCDMPESTDVGISLARNGMQLLACGVCGRYVTWDTRKRTPICSHIGSALLLLDRYLYHHNPGDDTNEAGERFLQGAGSVRKRKALTEEHGREKGQITEICLEPRISIKDKLMLSFKIGTPAKTYVLKSIPELAAHVADKDRMPLGKTMDIDFGRAQFTPQSRRYWEIIHREADRFGFIRRKLVETNGEYFLKDIQLKGEIELTGQALDDFFDLALEQEGGKVEIRSTIYAMDEKYFRFKDEIPRITIRISPLPGRRFHGLGLHAVIPEMLEGEKYRYFADYPEAVLYRITEAAGKGYLGQLLAQADEIGEIDLEIGQKHLQQFFYEILPQLENEPSVHIIYEKQDVIQNNIPPRAKVTFYLDAEENRALCRAQAAYGEQIHRIGPEREDDPPLGSYRDVQQEQQILEAVEELFSEYDPKRDQYSTDGSDEALYTLLESGIDTLMQYGEVQSTDTFLKFRMKPKVPVTVGVGIDGNLLDLHIDSEDIDLDELQQLLAGYRRKKRFHRLSSGTFVHIEDDAVLETLSRMMEAMSLDVRDLTQGEMKIPMYRALYLDKMLEEHDEIACRRDRSFRKMIREFYAVKDSDFDVPTGITAKMRSYQVSGYKWMRILGSYGFHGILADDMGLGKTLQMIAVLAAVRGENLSTLPSLVVCPSSLVYNWQEECSRFAPALQTLAITGSAAWREEMITNHLPDYDVCITSYDLLKRDIKLYEGKRFFYEILDEAQYIKNPKAAAAKSVKVIDSEHRMALTGTPIENRLSELWSIFDYLMPGFLYQYEKFRQEIETPIVKNQEKEITERLKMMISPFVLRRLKGDVLKDLPDKVEEIRYARFDQEQQKLYDAQVLHMKNFLAQADNTDRIRILAEITKIRQICCDPGLLFENYEGESAKRTAAMQLIGSAIDGGHRILLFSQFTSMLEMLEKDLQDSGITYYKITGATSKEERIRLVHAFNEDDTPIFLISLKAGGTGLNLTGADVVIHYDPWWNLAAQNQATDRAHRIGQKNKVTVYKLIAKGTIEEKIVKLQEAKRDLADAVIGGEAASLASLSPEEIEELFS